MDEGIWEGRVSGTLLVKRGCLGGSGMTHKTDASCADSGTTWLSESADEVDSGVERWKQLARQLKDDLSNIILMSEEDLQVQGGNL